METAEPPGSRYPPADPRRRALGRGVDLLVALAPLLLVPAAHAVAGVLLSGAFLLCGDRLFGPGRSLGKRVAGLRCIVLATRRPADLVASLRRNVVFLPALVPALLAGPGRLPWTCALLACACAVEAFVALSRLTTDLGQRRLGDLWAGTQVIDASLALGLPAQTDPGLAAAPSPLASRAALVSAAHGRYAVSSATEHVALAAALAAPLELVERGAPAASRKPPAALSVLFEAPACASR